MEDRSLRSPSSSNTAEKDGSASQKQAACLNCRKSKTRCLRNVAEDIRCKKCAQTGADCIVPDYRVGRKKGIKMTQHVRILWVVEPKIVHGNPMDLEQKHNLV